MFGLLFSLALAGQSPPITRESFMIIGPPAAVAPKKISPVRGNTLRIRWWVDNVPPGYTPAQMNEVVGEAAKRWEVANIEFIPANRPEEANLIINSEAGSMAWVGLTDQGGPHALRAGQRIKLRINSGYRLTKRNLLANLCHEIGHALGLVHHSAGSVMEPMLFGTTELSPTDRTAILKLYPR